ncbi:hypothetical protein Fuma_06336 [Fuerstiella marisgermanici]|uniref:Uncharacterized protein n=1 Tax=Fuerstiella marisgermanici TaxID=1891926 RepID=A0A1P8WRH8_9PLAN|nr:hypothetical protein Fuma_06336 [Fuerstiella marisgermanici]
MSSNPCRPPRTLRDSRTSLLAPIRSRWAILSFAVVLGLLVPALHRSAIYESGLSLWLLLPAGFITCVAFARPIFSVLASTVLVVVFSNRLYFIDTPWVYIGPPFDPDTVYINATVATTCFSICLSAVVADFFWLNLLRP